MDFKEFLTIGNYSRNTLLIYMRYHYLLQRCIEAHGKTQEAINQFILAHNHKVSRAFLLKYLEYLNTERQGLFYDIPKLKGRPNKKLPVWLEKHEIDFLIDCSPVPYNFLWAVCFEGGCRISEALKLTKKDVLGYGENGGLVVSSKGGIRRVNLTIKNINLLMSYARRIPNIDDPIFQFDRQHAKYMIRKTVKELFPNKSRAYLHMLRTSCATYLLKKGMDIRNIQHYLGHKNISTTSVYAQISERDIRTQWSAIMEVPPELRVGAEIEQAFQNQTDDKVPQEVKVELFENHLNQNDTTTPDQSTKSTTSTITPPPTEVKINKPETPEEANGVVFRSG